MKVEMNLTKENMLIMLLEEYDLNIIKSTIYFDITSCKSINEVEEKLELIEFDLDDFKEKSLEVFKERELKLTELNKLMFHELVELGEKKLLWTSNEKQKRLVD